MGLIEDFIARYTKEYDFYDQAGRLAARLLESDLQAAGVRFVVTSRAKSIARLQDKCRQREQDQGTYSSVDKIFDDIVDLAGVRVALYFPAESGHVDGIITRVFHVIRTKKEFPASAKSPFGKKFSGYSATHYRVQLKEQDLSGPEKRYAAARIEIQVASVLMHAWSEVEHDLVYKPLEGDLSEGEYAALDQLNGLVLAGEMALEMLQKAGQARVAMKGRKMANHYDLAVHLLSRSEEMTGEPVNDAGLGRVDLLFDLISELKINTAKQLAPYLEALHGNVELRPLSEQIIDALLAEDASRYEVYSSIKARRNPAFYDADPEDLDIEHQVGVFMTRWISLEALLRRVVPPDGRGRPLVVNMELLRKLSLLDQDMRIQLDRLRRMRNNLVHGIEIPSVADLTEAAQRIGAIHNEIIQRYGGQNPES